MLSVTLPQSMVKLKAVFHWEATPVLFLFLKFIICGPIIFALMSNPSLYLADSHDYTRFRSRGAHNCTISSSFVKSPFPLIISTTTSLQLFLFCKLLKVCNWFVTASISYWGLLTFREWQNCRTRWNQMLYPWQLECLMRLILHARFVNQWSQQG